MFKPYALGGVTALAACGALVAASSSSLADHVEGHVLPEVTVEAPRAVHAKPARKPKAHAAAARRSARATASVQATPQRVIVTGGSVGPPAALANLAQSPAGQTTTTIDRGRFDNRPSFSVSDVLRDSPGISVKQGNGPRDFGISIRGSNARNGFAIRNMVIFDDGFPVTQPDGLSRSDLIDPRAYGAIDVIRGPSSALYGNYATGGALNFRTRPGGAIDGVEYGIDGGSFGYLNNYLAVGKKVGNFEASLFASDARGDGFIGNSWFNTQTVNFLGHYQATPDDRFTLKIINNNVDGRLPIRLSLNQFEQNPFQRGCVSAVGAAVGCATVSLFANGFNGPRSPQTAEQAGLGRTDRRTIVGARWEHDFDNQTTWRNQLVFDDRNINQPTGATSAIGDYPSYNFMSDVTHKGQLFGFDSTTYFGGFYNTLSWSGDTRNLMPGGGATLGLLSSNVTGTHTNFGLRAREELKLTDALTAIAGIGWENTQLKGVNTAFRYPVLNDPTAVTALTRADKQFTNIAPEFALLYKFSNEWQGRARVGTGYGTPQVGNLFVLPDGTNGNNTGLVPQRNVGYDLGVDWSPNKTVKVSLTGFYEFFRNELVSQATPIGSPNANFTFNAPRSEHRGIELAADWRFHPGWRATLAYTYLDEIYTDYTEIIRGGATAYSFNRAGNKIPGVSPHELTARLGYDETAGIYAGLGAFVEFQWKDAFFMDNGNLLKAPGYELVNLNVHYATDLKSDLFKTLNVYFEVRNLFDKTYVASANNIGNTVTGGVQSPASVLANSTGSIYAGSPRAFIAGMKVAFR